MHHLLGESAQHIALTCLQLWHIEEERCCSCAQGGQDYWILHNWKLPAAEGSKLMCNTCHRY